MNVAKDTPRIVSTLISGTKKKRIILLSREEFLLRKVCSREISRGTVFGIDWRKSFRGFFKPLWVGPIYLWLNKKGSITHGISMSRFLGN